MSLPPSPGQGLARLQRCFGRYHIAVPIKTHVCTLYFIIHYSFQSFSSILLLHSTLLLYYKPTLLYLALPYSIIPHHTIPYQTVRYDNQPTRLLLLLLLLLLKLLLLVLLLLLLLLLRFCRRGAAIVSCRWYHLLWYHLLWPVSRLARDVFFALSAECRASVPVLHAM